MLKCPEYPSIKVWKNRRLVKGKPLSSHLNCPRRAARSDSFGWHCSAVRLPRSFGHRSSWLWQCIHHRVPSMILMRKGQRRTAVACNFVWESLSEALFQMPTLALEFQSSGPVKCGSNIGATSCASATLSLRSASILSVWPLCFRLAEIATDHVHCMHTKQQHLQQPQQQQHEQLQQHCSFNWPATSISHSIHLKLFDASLIWRPCSSPLPRYLRKYFNHIQQLQQLLRPNDVSAGIHCWPLMAAIGIGGALNGAGSPRSRWPKGWLAKCFAMGASQ